MTPDGHALFLDELAKCDDCVLLEVDADHFAPIKPRSAVWPTVVGAVSSLCAEPVRADVP